MCITICMNPNTDQHQNLGPCARLHSGGLHRRFRVPRSRSEFQGLRVRCFSSFWFHAAFGAEATSPTRCSSPTSQAYQVAVCSFLKLARTCKIEQAEARPTTSSRWMTRCLAYIQGLSICIIYVSALNFLRVPSTFDPCCSAELRSGTSTTRISASASLQSSASGAAMWPFRV